MSIRQSFLVCACSGLLPQSRACVLGFQVGSTDTCSLKLGDHLAFCLAAPLETINRPAEKQAQWFCVPEGCSAVLRGTLGTSPMKGSCWKKKKVALAVSFNQGHLMVALSAADPTISILRAFPGSLKSCFRKAERAAGRVLLSQGVREHRCAVTVLQHSAGLGVSPASSTAWENMLMI